MNRKIHYFVSIAAFSLQPTIAFGQTKATVKEAALQAVQEGTQGGTSSSSTFSTLAPAFQIETSGDDTNATVSMSFSISSPEEPKTLPNEATTLTFGTTTANIAASAPLGKNGKPSLFDFDRLVMAQL